MVYGKIHDGLLKLALRSRKSVEEVFEHQTLQEIHKALLASLDNDAKDRSDNKANDLSLTGVQVAQDFCRSVKGVPDYAESKIIAETGSPPGAPAAHTFCIQGSPPAR